MRLHLYLMTIRCEIALLECFGEIPVSQPRLSNHNVNHKVFCSHLLCSNSSSALHMRRSDQMSFDCLEHDNARLYNLPRNCN